MDEPGNNDFKLDLANRFVYFPLARLLIFSFWFRLIFAGFLLFLVFLALFLPRIWRTTPPGFLPVIKISGLDMAQAWSLRRSALRSTKAGDLDQATYAWQAAVARNPANPPPTITTRWTRPAFMACPPGRSCRRPIDPGPTFRRDVRPRRAQDAMNPSCRTS